MGRIRRVLWALQQPAAETEDRTGVRFVEIG
jgi:hypothetical protein